MKKRELLLLGLLLLLFACSAKAPKAAGGPATKPLTPGAFENASNSIQKATVRETWEEEWQKILIAGQREGTVVIFSGGAETREPYTQAFKAKYGISLEFVAGRGDQLVNKVLQERRAGLYLNDVYVVSPTVVLQGLKPTGALDPLESALILPEVTDAKYWWGGKLPWIDEGHYVFQFTASVNVPIGINTDSVKPEEITSYKDLLDPKWKGKMTINDPTLQGTGQNWFTVTLATGKLDEAYFRKLVEQKPLVIQDQRLQIDWLARGKYPIAISPKSDILALFQNEGAPVKGIITQEGTYISGGSNTISLFNRAPHPNAAKVFINWLLSKEGVTIHAKARGGDPPLRVDVPTDFLDPAKMLQPGVSYFRPDEKFYTEGRVYDKLAKEIFGPLMEGR